MLRNENVLGDVDEQLGFLEHFKQVLWCHFLNNLVSRWRHCLLVDQNALHDGLVDHAFADFLDRLDTDRLIFTEKDKDLVVSVLFTLGKESELCSVDGGSTRAGKELFLEVFVRDIWEASGERVAAVVTHVMNGLVCSVSPDDLSVFFHIQMFFVL